MIRHSTLHPCHSFHAPTHHEPGSRSGPACVGARRRAGLRFLLPVVREHGARRPLPALGAARARTAERPCLVVLPAAWWGVQWSADATRLPAVIAAAHAAGLSVAVHMEPYAGRTVESTVADVAYLRALGVRMFYVYRPLDLPVADWAAAKAALHQGGSTLFAQTALAGAAAAGGFD